MIRNMILTAAIALSLAGCAGAPDPVVAPVGDTGNMPSGLIASYTYSVTGDISGPVTINWNFDGSSGSASGVPWTKRVDAQSTSDQGGTLTAVSESGATGSLTCTVTSNQSGNVISTKTATSDGSPSAFASVACGTPVNN